MKPIYPLMPVALLALTLATAQLGLCSFAEPTSAAQPTISQPASEMLQHQGMSHKKYKHDYKKLSPEERETKHVEWAKSHPEKAAEWAKKKAAFQQKHPEYAAQKEQWKTLSHDERKAKRKQWLAQHPEEAKAIKADYKAMHSECRASHKSHKNKASQSQ